MRWPRPLTLALGFGATMLARQALHDRAAPIERFDEGIRAASVTLTELGFLSHADYYQPYGIAIGLPGLIPRLLGFDGLLAQRLSYSVALALATTLAVLLVERRRGTAAAIAVGLACLAAETPRYALVWCALLAFALIVERAASHCGAKSIADLAARRPRALMLAGAVLSLAGWVRVEYLVLPLLWAAFVAHSLRRGGRRTRQVLWLVALALAPSLIVVGTGGATEYLRYLDYSASDFREWRGVPIDLGPVADWVRGLATFEIRDEGMALVGSYGIGVLVAAALLVRIVGRVRGRSPVAGNGVVPWAFFALVAVFVLYGQSQRFAAGYGLAAIPVFWTAAALSPIATARGRRLALGAGLVIAIGMLGAYTPAKLRDLWRQHDRIDVQPRELIARLGGIPIRDREWQSLAALRAVWHAHGHDGEPTLAVGLHNDVAVANEPIVHWLLDSPPAAWTVTNDPGLADRDDVQRDVVARLCANDAAVIQRDEDDTFYRQRWPRHGSRRLDAHLALNTRVEAVAGFYRIRVPENQRCLDPYLASDATLLTRRDLLLTRDDAVGAGAVALVRMDRARAAHHQPEADDAAIAILGGYWVDDTDLGAGHRRAVLAALRDSGPPPRGSPASIALHSGTSGTALAAQAAWIAYRSGTTPRQHHAVIAAIGRTLAAHPDWPQALRNLASVVPLDAAALDRLRATGVRGPLLDRMRFEAALKSADAAAALEPARVVLADLANDPVAAGGVEISLAARLAGAGHAGCAATLLRRADARAGVRVEVPDESPCSLRLP